MTDIQCNEKTLHGTVPLLTSNVMDNLEQHTLCAKMAYRCPKAAEKLRYLTRHDVETGLPNLILLLERAEQELQSERPCSLLLLVVNGVHEIGEHHSLAAALYALHTTAARIQTTIGDAGFAARIQGELFVVVNFGSDPLALAEQLWAVLDVPIEWHQSKLQLSVSIGAVRDSDRGRTAEGMLQAAYAAAKAGAASNPRGGVHLFTQAMGVEIERSYQLTTRLRSALTNGSLSLAMQAKVAANDGRLIGAESLLRWQDVQFGYVSPSEFIPLAERSGIITNITPWVLRESLRQAVGWRQAGLDLSVAVNLSAVDLRRQDLISDVRKILAYSACDPSSLIIELTESSVAEDPALAAKQLFALKDMGVSLSLDDFGTGYSSLSYLRRFPLDSLKIDRTFVADIQRSGDAMAIVKSIIALAHTLDMTTVAEGVEVEEQVVCLSALGIDVFQGYFFSRPCSPESFLMMAKSPKEHHWSELWDKSIL